MGSSTDDPIPMHIQAGDNELLIRAAEPADDDYIISLAPRWAEFELPKGRKRLVVIEGIRRDLRKHLDGNLAGSFMFIAETDEGEAAGFLHLQLVTDFFSGKQNCHISDLAVSPGWDGRGVARALLAYAENFAREHRCERLTLAVFPANARGRKLYEAAGYEIDTLRMAKAL
jgi:ribosomal protein S18 acetylase RimI-like enzyme